MKPTIILFLFVALVASAQQTVDLPVKMTVAFPTNYFPVATPKKMTMTNNIVAPVARGIDLVKTVTAPTQFQLGVFPADSSLVLFIVNPAKHQLTWPSGLFVIDGRMPTNAARAAIVFEAVGNEVWASPSTP